jgi:LAO/AO transport system kinase
MVPAKKPPAESSALADRVRAGDRKALGRAITLVESTREEDRGRAVEMLGSLMEATGDSTRVGVSGAPGVGKSTFIDRLGCHLIDGGHRVAVLAIDPSSTVSGGSILGDKTRMEQLARLPDAFVRPSPAGRALGGVARGTREAILLCEAAGFDIILVETVGVGQSETMVAGMTDVFLLLLAPGSGDELQGIKRGIIELADVVAVNKTDGELESAARRTAADYSLALSVLRPRTQAWKVPVQLCSALIGQGVPEVWDHVERYMAALRSTGEITMRRTEQARVGLSNETTRLVTRIGRLLHVAIAVPDIGAAAATYRDVLGAVVSESIELPGQGVLASFVDLPNTRIELLQPLGEGSPITSFLERNKSGGMHHACFEVEDIMAARDDLTAAGARALGEPRPGAHGDLILFLHPGDFQGTLIELQQARGREE